jgi:hypothetical protein
VAHVVKEKGDVLFAEYIGEEEITEKEERKDTQQVIPLTKPKRKVIPGYAAALVQRRFFPVYAAAVFFLIVLIVYMTTQTVMQNDFLATLHFDDQVPHEFVPISKSSLRNPDDPELNTAFETFYDTFLAGMLEYQDLNYQEAIDKLKPLEPEVSKLQADLTDTETLSVIRDYYFYLGISYLAMARSKLVEIAKEKRRSYLQKSLQLLSISKKVASNNQFKMLDRDMYFLALTLYFTGKIDLTIQELKNIKQESLFYSKATLLIRTLKD